MSSRALDERWRSAWPGLVVFATLWFCLINQLRVEWTVNDQYSYGWFVPGLALYLFWEAWLIRPEPQRPTRHFFVFILCACLLLLLPLRIVQEANPDWRPVSWSLALITVGITWCGLYARGGASWWRHFAFSCAFILAAVPWPTALEQTVVRELMQWVAAITVEVLTWLGTPAKAMGNVIALPGQLVGVDEACSGVRSLQTVIMASLFLGELYRLSWLRRGALLGLAVLLAFVTNVARAFLLVSIVAHEGAASLAHWHDPVGYAVLIASLAGVWGLGAWLKPHAASEADLAVTKNDDWLFTAAMGSTRVLGAILAWIVVVEVATEGWYRSHELQSERAQPWTVQLPSTAPQFKPVKLSETESRQLRVSRVEAGSWIEPNGSEVLTFFLRWEPGRNAAQLARLHRPEVCLPSAGCFLKADEGLWTASVDGLSLPFRRLVFDYNGTPLYVFYCLSEDRVVKGAVVGEDWTAQSRLRAVAEGRRHLGQQVLEIIVSGPRQPEQAEAILRQMLPSLVKPEGRR